MFWGGVAEARGTIRVARNVRWCLWAALPSGGGDDPARPAVRNCWVWLHRQPRRRSGLPWVVLQVSLATGSCGLLLLRFYFGAAMGRPCGPGGPLKGGDGRGQRAKMMAVVRVFLWGADARVCVAQFLCCDFPFRAPGCPAARVSARCFWQCAMLFPVRAALQGMWCVGAGGCLAVFSGRVSIVQCGRAGRGARGRGARG